MSELSIPTDGHTTETGTALISLEKRHQLQKAANYYFKRQLLANFRGVIFDPKLSSEIIGNALANTHGLRGEARQDLITLIKNSPDLISAWQAITQFLCQYVDVQAYEEHRRQDFIVRNNFTPLNETWSYSVDDSVLFLHLAPSRTLTESERLEQQQLAFATLAETLTQVGDLAEVEQIAMISELMASPKYKAISEALGFRVVQIMDPGTLEQFPPKHRSRVFAAVIGKSEFVESALS